MVAAPFQNYYAGRKVLVTGHTGFKGSWLSLWLKALGAEVFGLSRPAAPPPNLYELIDSGVFSGETMLDIRDAVNVAEAVRNIRPDFIFHLAAQALVRLSYEKPAETFEINVMGTVNLLEAVRSSGTHCPIIVVTSDKCYENHDWDWGYRENDPLGGHDVYSMSKAATELVVQSWRRSFFAGKDGLGPIATARALIGNRPIPVRNPRSTRPWQHVLDCLSGYLWLGALLGSQTRPDQYSNAFNFGPDARSNRPVDSLVDEFLRHWPGSWLDQSRPDAPHEANVLHLNTDRAAKQLEWYPTWTFGEAVRQTAKWYSARHEGRTKMAAFSREQIWQFAADAADRGQKWATPQ